VDERGRRIGENEGLFREVNERIKGVSEGFSLVLENAEFVCECGQVDCSERITMTLEDYERVRKEPTWFAIVPGHEIPDVETVVERNPAYHVVRKDEGEPARLARETDPRSA